jgi:alpha-beta hydrolase superfamily lysophospholipase
LSLDIIAGKLHFQSISLDCKHWSSLSGVVSHLGHSSKPLNTNKQLYTLQEQIQHKVDCFDLIRKQYGSDTKVILIGHSVGSFICTEVLKARPNHNIVRLIALFPTLQHIAKTPNGVALSVSKSSLAKSYLKTFSKLTCSG